MCAEKAETGKQTSTGVMAQIHVAVLCMFSGASCDGQIAVCVQLGMVCAPGSSGLCCFMVEWGDVLQCFHEWASVGGHSLVPTACGFKEEVSSGLRKQAEGSGSLEQPGDSAVLGRVGNAGDCLWLD